MKTELKSKVVILVAFSLLAAASFTSGRVLSLVTRKNIAIMFFASNKIDYIRLWKKINSGNTIERSQGYILAVEMGIADIDFLKRRYFLEKNRFVKKIILKRIRDCGGKRANSVLSDIALTEDDESLIEFIRQLISGKEEGSRTVYDMEIFF